MSEAVLTREHLDLIRDPYRSLQAFGYLVNQKTGLPSLWDPRALTKTAQTQVVNFIANPPRDQYGQTRWLNVLKPRQVGLSTVGALAFYPKTAYSPGHDHATIADKKDRAEYLHSRINFLHERWPEELRSPTTTKGQTRAYEFKNGAKIRTLSAQEAAAGIGQSIDSLLASEAPLWDDAAGVMSLLNPAMINRDNSIQLFEATAYPLNSPRAPSAEYWRDRYAEGKRGVGRALSVFYPFWDGVLNVRKWNPKDKPDTAELRLLEQYGHRGLTLDGLAFRRFVLDNDQEFRRNPELFAIFYPFDDISCWVTAGSGVFPRAGLDRLMRQPLLAWRGPEMVYKPPDPAARYVIGVDPAGFAIRDHASFQVLEVWRDEIEQVAVYSDNFATPNEFCAQLIRMGRHYNNAMIVVESNGVGAAVLALLNAANYRNIYHEAPGKPGRVASAKSIQAATAWLADAMMDTLVLHDDDTWRQLDSYGNDKLVERGETAEILSPDRRGPRRERHHWDKVSALMMAICGAREGAQRDKRPANVSRLLQVHPQDWTVADWTAWRAAEDAAAEARKRQAGGGVRLKWHSGMLRR